jgi:periplasmic divalent cation tolerance protein
MYLVICNAPAEVADAMARAVVEAGHAACVNLAGPVRSIYRWRGAVETAEEITLVCKVSEDRVGLLRAQLRALHPYEVAEILAIPVDVSRSDPDYVDWVRRAGGDE